MKHGLLCLSLVFACSCTLFEDYPYLAYDLRWTCVSPAGCEREEQVALIDRAAITETNDSGEFWSTRNAAFRVFTRLLASDSLPPRCFLLNGFVLFENELEASLLCHTDDGFTLELSVPDRESPTHSEWRVEGRYTGRITYPPR